MHNARPHSQSGDSRFALKLRFYDICFLLQPWFSLWVVRCSDCWRDPPAPPPIPGLNLNAWHFDDTNLLSAIGAFPPKATSNLNLVSSWEGNAVEIAGTSAILQYNEIEIN